MSVKERVQSFYTWSVLISAELIAFAIFIPLMLYMLFNMILLDQPIFFDDLALLIRAIIEALLVMMGNLKIMYIRFFADPLILTGFVLLVIYVIPGVIIVRKIRDREESE